MGQKREMEITGNQKIIVSCSNLGYSIEIVGNKNDLNQWNMVKYRR